VFVVLIGDGVPKPFGVSDHYSTLLLVPSCHSQRQCRQVSFVICLLHGTNRR